MSIALNSMRLLNMFFIIILMIILVQLDEWPQWRRMAWTPDCSILAIASSNGVVNFYDLLGCKIFSILPVSI